MTTRHMMQPLMRWLFAWILLFLTAVAYGSPVAPTGDTELRHDVEYLADRGLISVPVTTWPMSWADLIAAVDSIDRSRISRDGTREVLARLEARIAASVRWGVPHAFYSVGGSDNRSRLRTYDDRPRGTTELTLGVEYIGRSFYAHIEAEAVSDALDGQTVRFDESRIGFIFNNLVVEAGGQSSWWGPGHAGSLILSNNARAVPGLSIRRNVAERFGHRWLRWIGPWSAKGFVGQLEDDRFVSRALLLGLRVTAKPLPSLELGASRTAQWAGSGRPDSFSNFIKLLLGRDNAGEVSLEQEPGNQLAGFDARWSINRLPLPVTFYGQVIGEDEAGGFPSRYLGMGGISTSFELPRWQATARVNIEYSDTTCQFHESSKRFNCAYNNGIYQTGYRYRGQSIGHSTDNDSSQLALIATVNTHYRHSWVLTVRDGKLNRGGPDDLRNSLTPSPVDYSDFDVKYTRPLGGAKLELGVGYHNEKNVRSGESESEARLFARWSSKLD